jgi:hypothetical protein
MVTISRVHKSGRVRGSGTTRADALANLEQSIRWVNRLGWLSRLPAAASQLVRPRFALQLVRRRLGIH